MKRRRAQTAVTLFSAVVAAALACSCSSTKQNPAISAFHIEAIQSGRASPTIDYKDPVLNQRKILLNAALNELTSGEIIAKLWKERARLPNDWFPLQAEKVHFLTPKMALEYRVIDEIAKPAKE